jgi:Zn-dependent protease
MAAMDWFALGFAKDEEIPWKIAFYVLLVFSLTFHEYGHAWSAKKLGDDTAELMGRLSLNPLVHLDPIFTVALPLFFLFSGGGAGIFFAAAKPVPVNPFRLHKPTRDMMITSAAGPFMNVVLALFFTGAFWFHSKVRGVGDFELSSMILKRAIGLNLGLALFNMIPIPPLDGHRVLGYFLPTNLRDAYYRIGYSFGLVILLLLMFSGWLNRIFVPMLIQIALWWQHLMPGDNMPAYF